MAGLEQIARAKGWDSALKDNQIWQSFKQKSPDQIIPHAEQILKETGNIGAVLKFFISDKK